MKNVYIISLGCPKNLTDTEVMAGHLVHKGYVVTTDENKADIVLINTCAFISPAVKESAKEINRLIKLKKSGRIKKIIVTGCLVEREKKNIIKKFPGIDAFLGISALDRIDSAIEKNKNYFLPHKDILNSPEHKLRLTLKHSTYLKIADGCNNFCSYCTIPMLRGRYRSKPLEQVVNEANALVQSGAKEISLTAQDSTSYGIDIYGKPCLDILLERLVKIKGIKWLRIMYVHPDKIDTNVLRLIKNEPIICKYLDIPLQHISDSVLRGMNRKSTEKSIKRTIEQIRKIIPGIAIRTNFIVGFPGETDKDFQKLLDFVRETKFENIGIFKYYREKETKAWHFKKQVPEKIKIKRFKELIKVQSKVVDEINRELIGKKVKILLDTPHTGRTQGDAPDIDGRVEIVHSSGLTPGIFVRAKIIAAQGYVRQAVL